MIGKARLIPTTIEIPRPRHGKPSYALVPGVKIITPEGSEVQPYMRVREAKAFCRAQGWDWIEL